MKIKKGDRLVGINPNSGKKERYIYLGSIDEDKHPEIVKAGYTKKLLDVRYKIEIMVSDAFIKRYQLKPYKRAT